MKRTQQLTADNLLAWKRTEAELRREFQTQEAALQKTLGKLRAELAKVTDEARENRDKSHKLQASLTAAENNIKVSVTLKGTHHRERERERLIFLYLNSGFQNVVYSLHSWCKDLNKSRCSNNSNHTSQLPDPLQYKHI